MTIRIDQPIIRAERKRQDSREIIHIPLSRSPKMGESVKPPVTRFSRALVIIGVLLTGALLALTG